jgi:ribonuclease J
MQSFDDTADTNQYLTLKQRFQVYENSKGQISRATGDKVTIPRQIKTFESGKKFSIDSIEVQPLPVDHSIPGVHGFILGTSSGMLANTADLRFHGRRADDTEKFVQKCADSDIDLMLCEGTRVAETSSTTEYDVESQVSEIIKNTKNLVVCGYPVRDLDRLLSFYLAAKKTGRYLVVDMKQAYLLKLFDSSTTLKGQYPSPRDPNLKIYIPKGSWGLLDKDLEKFSQRQLVMDYDGWQQEFLDYPNVVDYRDVLKNQKDFVFYCSDYKLQELIDVKPKEGSSYIRSLTEPFDEEMELKEEQIKNWLEHFGLITKERQWHQIHVSGHGDSTQIKKVIEETKSKKLIPIHTEHEEYHKKCHPNVKTVNQSDSVKL